MKVEKALFPLLNLVFEYDHESNEVILYSATDELVKVYWRDASEELKQIIDLLEEQ